MYVLLCSFVINVIIFVKIKFSQKKTVESEFFFKDEIVFLKNTLKPHYIWSWALVYILHMIHVLS